MASVKKAQLNHMVIYFLNRLRYVWGGIHGPELSRYISSLFKVI